MELGIRHRYAIKQSHPSLDLPLYIAPLKLVLLLQKIVNVLNDCLLSLWAISE